MTTANLNIPRLGASGPLTGDELDRLQLRRAADRAALQAVATGIAMQTNCNGNCQQGRPCDCVRDHTGDEIEDEGRDALEQQLDAVNAGVWRWGLGLGLAAIGLLAVWLR